MTEVPSTIHEMRTKHDHDHLRRIEVSKVLYIMPRRAKSATGHVNRLSAAPRP